MPLLSSKYLLLAVASCLLTATGSAHANFSFFRKSFNVEELIQEKQRNFKTAKRDMHVIFTHLKSPKTIYCGCDIKFTKHYYYPDLESCGYHNRSPRNLNRAHRIEAEHIMPAWEFGKDQSCWTKHHGRQNCENTSDRFNMMESDLHNLYPAVGEVNGDRSNYAFSDAVRNAPSYGLCDMKIDRKRQRVTPPERSRGLIARAYLYMSETYSVPLDEEHKNLFNRWNKMYNPDKNECLRNELIGKVQGNLNHFVTEKCK